MSGSKQRPATRAQWMQAASVWHILSIVDMRTLSGSPFWEIIIGEDCRSNVAESRMAKRFWRCLNPADWLSEMSALRKRIDLRHSLMGGRMWGHAISGSVQCCIDFRTAPTSIGKETRKAGTETVTCTIIAPNLPLFDDAQAPCIVEEFDMARKL